MNGILSLITWLPLAAAIILFLLPHSMSKIARPLGFVAGAATFALGVLLAMKFDAGTYQFQFVEDVEWLPSMGIHYRMGVDGISLWLVPLTGLLTLVALGFSTYVQERTKLFVALLLVLETAMIGTFLSLDMIVFYTFFELGLIPMYFLISIWGGERRRYAAAKFFIYTFAGSIFMLVGMVALSYFHYRSAGFWSFGIVDIQNAVASGKLWAGAVQAQAFIFWAFAIAFLIKAPAFPFHTWIPDTYAESPVVGPILSSVMVKMGSYGLLRFCLPLFPDVLEKQIPILSGLAVVGILYGGTLAIVQKDVRRMLAYSSLSHMGFVLLGIFSLNQVGMLGGSYQQLSHGITAAALFLLVGCLIQRRGTANLDDFGGLKSQMPTFATLFLISMLASVGLPGLSGFIGEFFALMGAFKSGYDGMAGLNTIYAALAGGGVVLAAAYLLYLYQQVFYGRVSNPLNARLKDIKGWEVGLASLLVIFMFWGGLQPKTFTEPMETSLSAARQMALYPVGKKPTWTDGRTSLVATNQ